MLYLLSFYIFASSNDSLLNGTSYTKTKYPIILVHGLFGFRTLAGIDYFYGIPSSLTKDGAMVYVAQVSGSNSIEVRGEQLLEQIETLITALNIEKVNLIGHSQGGLTARYAASISPELVASVTSIGSPHKGSPVADLIRANIKPNSYLELFSVKLSTGLTSLIHLLSTGNAFEQDPISSLEALTTNGSLEFNKYYPEGIPLTECGNGKFLENNGVYYYSWTGSSTYTNILDPADSAMALVGLSFNEPNDGIVGVCSSHLGKVIRDDYKMNHLDEINGLFGLHHLFEISPISLYRQHANRLKLQGL
ncbi:esterase/lipase family protein [Aliivibrio salmonicida]|uniref:esterase/lipase family protein n=1 Tax=Aliivibrio salmonicida TaxID=40269 RepID=UPI003D0B880E